MKIKKILILLGIFAIVAGFTLSPMFAATKTVKFKDSDLKKNRYYDWDVGKKVGKFKVRTIVGLDDYYTGKTQAILSVESKKKFKSATFYVNGMTYKGKFFTKKYTYKAKKGFDLDIGKHYYVHKVVRSSNYFTDCRKVVIKY